MIIILNDNNFIISLDLYFWHWDQNLNLFIHLIIHTLEQNFGTTIMVLMLIIKSYTTLH